MQSPGRPPPPPKNKIWIIVLVVALIFMALMFCVCSGLLFPAVQAAREAARRMSCSNNMKQVAIGMHNYHSDYGSLPPAYTVDANGRPLHSWRTLLLPYVEQQGLYEQIDRTKPWDDPVNIAFSEVVVPVYSCPSFATGADGAMTTYMVVVDPESCFPGSTSVSFRQIMDGLPHTVMIVECETDQVVPWMMPQDINRDQFLALSNHDHSRSHLGGENTAMCDGAVLFLTSETNTTEREQLISIAGETNSGLDRPSETLEAQRMQGNSFPSPAAFHHSPSKAMWTLPHPQWNLLTGEQAAEINPAANAVMLHDGNAEHEGRIGILIIETLDDVIGEIDPGELDFSKLAKALADGMELGEKQIESIDAQSLFGAEGARYRVSGDVEGTGRLRYDCAAFAKNGYLIQLIIFGKANDLKPGDPAAQELYTALSFTP